MGVRTTLATVTTLMLAACSSTGTVTPPPPTSGPRTQIAPESSGPADRERPQVEAPEVGRLLTAYFDYDDSALRPDARGALRQNADVLRTRGTVRVELQGNCDERGTEEYNLALGKRRAESAKNYLVDLGIPAARLTTVSFGEENAAVQGSSEAAWAKNRRVDFVLR
jgi:peptidoglycan-associated lipoprotein